MNHVLCPEVYIILILTLSGDPKNSPIFWKLVIAIGLYEVQWMIVTDRSTVE